MGRSPINVMNDGRPLFLIHTSGEKRVKCKNIKVINNW